MSAPLVSIIGRPNVGKSTFFNRVLGQRRAVVHDRPGVTRDRNAARTEWGGRPFVLVDTGGFLPLAARGLEAVVRRQAVLALENSHVTLFMVDARTGITDLDMEIARFLKRRGKPCLVVVNKADDPTTHARHDFHRLGLGEPNAISSEQGYGIGELLDRLVALLPGGALEPERDERPRVAIVGRPNVGKSSLVNALMGEERMIVQPTPGTTVDAVDMVWPTSRGEFVLVDTAGIRKQPRHSEDTEFYAMLRALQALERSELAVLVVDATEGFQGQDARLAQHAWEAGRCLLLLYNKWDLLGEGAERAERWKRMNEERVSRYPTLAGVPAAPVSAVSRFNLHRIPALLAARAVTARKRVSTGELNRWLQEVQRRKAPPASGSGRSPRLYYMTQTGVDPPQFTIFAGHPSLVAENYRRFLLAQLAERFGLQGCPVRVRFKKSE